MAIIKNKGETVLNHKLFLEISILKIVKYLVKYIENTSWKVLAYGIYPRVFDVSEIERVSAAKE